MANGHQITVAEAARLLDVSPAHLRRLAAPAPGKRPPLPIFRRAEDGEDVIPRSAVRAYLSRRLEPHYSLSSAARLLDVDPATITRWIRAGRLQARTIHGLRRIPESSILAALTPAP